MSDRYAEIVKQPDGKYGVTTNFGGPAIGWSFTDRGIAKVWADALNDAFAHGERNIQDGIIELLDLNSRLEERYG